MNVRPEDWPRLKAIFNHAVTLEGPARAAYVAEACRDDPTMKRHAENLLASHDAAPAFLQSITAIHDS